MWNERRREAHIFLCNNLVKSAGVLATHTEPMIPDNVVKAALPHVDNGNAIRNWMDIHLVL